MLTDVETVKNEIAENIEQTNGFLTILGSLHVKMHAIGSGICRNHWFFLGFFAFLRRGLWRVWAQFGPAMVRSGSDLGPIWARLGRNLGAAGSRRGSDQVVVRPAECLRHRDRTVSGV